MIFLVLNIALFMFVSVVNISQLFSCVSNIGVFAAIFLINCMISAEVEVMNYVFGF